MMGGANIFPARANSPAGAAPVISGARRRKVSGGGARDLAGYGAEVLRLVVRTRLPELAVSLSTSARLDSG